MMEKLHVVEDCKTRTLQFTHTGGLIWKELVLDRNETLATHFEDERIFYFGTGEAVARDAVVESLKPGVDVKFEVRMAREMPGYVGFTVREGLDVLNDEEALESGRQDKKFTSLMRHTELVKDIYANLYLAEDQSIVHKPTNTTLLRSQAGLHYAHLDGAFLEIVSSL